MTTRPHDISDLFLAPVVLAVDARIEELAQLGAPELAEMIALESNRPDYRRAYREQALVMALEHLVELHEWKLTLDPRGIRLTHEDRHLVLGMPETFNKYLDGEGLAKAYSGLGSGVLRPAPAGG